MSEPKSDQEPRVEHTAGWDDIGRDADERVGHRLIGGQPADGAVEEEWPSEELVYEPFHGVVRTEGRSPPLLVVEE